MSSNRRQFILGSGALVVYFVLPGSGFAQYTSPHPGQPERVSGNASLDTWIRVEAGGRIIISAGKVEFGQGIRTALAQIAAEELDIEFSRVRMTEADTAHSPDESYTFSAVSVQQSGSRVRRAAAQARLILLDRAAEALGIPAAELSVSDGSIVHQEKHTDVDYWGLLAGGSFDARVRDDVPRKPVDQYQVVGYPVRRLDIPAKVFAQASYLADLRMPGMVHARIVRSRGPQLRLIGVATEAAAGMPGVLKIIQDGSFLAVVAEREFQASQAAANLAQSCTWQEGVTLPEAGKLSAWMKSARAETQVVAEHRAEDKLANPGEAGVKTLAAEYSRPFLAHASIAPSAAIALWAEHRLTVWSHGQGMYPLRGAIAHVLGLEKNQVRCIHAESGGVYGHNGADDAACDAAVIALHLPGRPVKLQWSRADEFSGEPYGSAMTVRIQAGLNARGRIVNWKSEVWSGTHSTRPAGPAGAGNLLYARQKKNPLRAPALRTIPQPSGGADRNAVPLYDIPELRVYKHLVQEMPLRVSALRSLGAHANIFALESFMDELALAAATDPFEFRLVHLSDQRARAVLEKLRDISEIGNKPEDSAGKGWGLGFAKYKNLSAYCAVLIQLSVDRDSGRIRLQVTSASLAMMPLTFPLSAVAGSAQQIPTRPIPSSGEPLPVLGLGQSAAFRNGDLALSTELLNILIGLGGSFVDTGGTGQGIMGQFMRNHHAHDQLFLGTNIYSTAEDEVLNDIHQAQQAQGKVALDLVQARSLDGLDRQWRKLLQWKEAGLTRYVGFAMSRRSFYAPVMALMETGTVDFVQVNYSVLEPEAAERVLPLAQDKGVAVVTNRPFVNGKYFSLVAGHSLPEWAQAFDCHSWAQFSLKFILAHPAINCVLTETTKAKHARENLSAAFGRLPDEPTRQRMVNLVRSLA